MIRAQKQLESDVIAFFPQALAWNPGNPHLESSSHDVPWAEPRLVRELLREPWPDRRWLARAYHRVRPRRAASARKVEQAAIDLHLSKIL
jgi:hypothetical protein